ncbi:MAG: hypothetical protein BJ554DRAFT_8190 [Olpidium bornovanus]|uniref:Transcription regulator Rua1 C-terminal domain-containing protein n=1 Tax=Olpidium bornovanus TaxID=278681 RepID=A0A8H7ZUQ5_9FUNG|nr:MAG: hypothetical protein BJ554DRAFT_8190 [Olpidium bornovanus]
MQFYHGVSSVSGKAFVKPLQQRVGESGVIDGLCHQCGRWVPISSAKRKNSTMWYRHAHRCHVYAKPKSSPGTLLRAL